MDEKKPLTASLPNPQLDIDFALQAAGLGAWELDPTTQLVNWDDRCRELFGLTNKNQLPYERALKHIHPDDVSRVDAAVKWAMNPKSGGTYDITFRTIGADDGQLRWVRFMGKGYFTESGVVYRFAGMAQDLTRDTQGQVRSAINASADMTDLALSRQQIEESENRFRTLANSIDQLAWIANADGWIYWYNERWYEYTGTTLEEMQGWGWQLVHHPDHQDRVVNFTRKAWGRDQPFELTFPLRDKVGNYRWFLTRAYPIKDEQGQVAQWVGTNTDIDEQKTMAERLEQLVAERTQQLQTSVQELERSNRNLEQFAYVASHDLQEPLRKIQSFSDLLKNQHVDSLGEGAIYLNRMQSAASRMSTLINDLLTYSRISTRQEETEPVHLGEVVELALNNLEVVTKETSAQITVESLPVIQGNASQLGQLFQNLLSNALKFRRDGVIPVIWVSCQWIKATDLPLPVRPAGVATSYYCIEVSDNGIGFDEKYADRIFGVFQRLHSKSQYPGTGIGLAICEKVVTNHGGFITASSQPGQGARFSIYLPTMID